MREIKFRAWDKEKKEMVVITSLNFWHDGGIKLANCGDVNEGNVMQYTGLKDKNGVEIYEGDIVKIFINTRYAGVEKVGQIICENLCHSFIFFGDTIELNDLAIFSIKVIGNIYKNPELLTPPTK